MKARPNGNGTGVLTRAQAEAILNSLKSRFLEGLVSGETSAIIAAASRKRYSADSVITSEGDPAKQVFLLLEGAARHYTVSPQGEKIVVRWVSPGEVFGMAAFLSEPMEYVLSTEAAE